MADLGIIAAGRKAAGPPVAGYTGWWDFSDAASLTIVGGKISQAKDKSASGWDLTQATAGKRPTQGTQNGLSTAVFTAANVTHLDNASVALTQPNTIFVVCKQNTASDTDFVFDGTSTRQVFYMLGSQYNLYAGSAITGGTTDTGWHVYSLEYNGAASKIFKDGALVIASNAGATNLSGLTVGAGVGEAGPFDGAIGEKIPYPLILSTGNRQAIEASLKTKWGTP